MRMLTLGKPYIALTALVLTTCLPLVAQRDTVRVGVELVVVPVSVRDSNSLFVSDLRKEDFRILEDGRSQVIRSVSLELMPLSAVVLIDTGFGLNRFSIASLAASFDSNDEAAVYGFDQNVRKASGFTNDRDELGKALGTIDETAVGLPRRTRNLDEGLLAAALDLRERAAGRKKVIVVISGAGAGFNVRRSEETRERLTQDQIQVWGVSVGEYFTIPPSDPRAPLRQYSDRTGGEVYRAPSESRQLQAAFARILEQARRQYMLSYISSNPFPGQTPVRRRIEVHVSRPHAKVTYRKEYFQYPAIK